MSIDIPNALERLDQIAAYLQDGKPAVFLDFDGTLAPIVDRPDEACLDSAMRQAVVRLAHLCPVAIISGRDLQDARERVGIGDICYAGSHGFDIACPGGVHHEHPKGIEALPALDAAERTLRTKLRDIAGALVERKRFSIAVHYRLAREQDIPAIERAVDAVLNTHAGLRKGHGKKVFELQPNVKWDKGAALFWLLQALALDRPDVRPLYLGDDVTDEDAFRAIANLGLGIVILDHLRPTSARYWLREPGEVRALLAHLADFLEPTR